MSYNWRKMTAEARAAVLTTRQATGQPWHSPPHGVRGQWYHISGSCYEHRPVIGHSPERLDVFDTDLRATLSPVCEAIVAWCVLPNHYHILVLTLGIRECRKALGKLHGRSSHTWNVEDSTPGRKCWHRCLPKPIRNEEHRWATINYIHHNPVHHKYVNHWRDWPYSSAPGFLQTVSRTQAIRLWQDYPLLNMGEGWDPPEL